MAKIGTVVNPEYNIDLKTIGIFDDGDIESDLPLEEGHQKLKSRVEQLLNLDGSSILDDLIR